MDAVDRVVLGAGAVGMAVAEALARRGEAVRVVNRSGFREPMAGVQSVVDRRAPSTASRSRRSSATSSTVRTRSSIVGRARTLSASISLRIARSASLRVSPSVWPLARTLPSRRLRYRPSGVRQRAWYAPDLMYRRPEP